MSPVNPKLQATLDRLESTRKEIKELEERMLCSVELGKMYPEAQWPVFTSIFIEPTTREFLFRIRDSNNAIKTFQLNEVPLILLNRPHIQKGCERNKELKRKIAHYQRKFEREQKCRGNHSISRS